MKKQFIFLLMMFLAFFYCFVNAQNPCGWGDVPSQQDSIDWAAVRYEGVVPKIPASQDPPKIDAMMDQVWFCSASPIAMQPYDEEYPNADPSLEADIRLLYDDEWLYVLVNVMHDNEIYYSGTAQNKTDRIEVFFQNTWGGRRDGTYNHCDEDDWWAFYWEQDGDLKALFTADRTLPLQWLDQDGSDGCSLPHACEEKEMDDWLTLDVMKKLFCKTTGK